MPLSPHKAGAADWPPGPNPPAPRGAPDTSDAFAGFLNVQQARTATAEGQNRDSQRSDAPRDRDRDDDRQPVANDRAEDRSNAAWAAERRAADGTTRDAGGQRAEGRGQKAEGSDAPAKPSATPAQPGAQVHAASGAAKPAAAGSATTQATPGLPEALVTTTTTTTNANTSTSTSTSTTATPQNPETPASQTTTTAQPLSVDPNAALAQGGVSPAATVPAANVKGSGDSTTAAAHGGVAAAVVSAVDSKAAQPQGDQVPVANRPQPAGPQQPAPSVPAQGAGSATTSRGGQPATGNANGNGDGQPPAQQRAQEPTAGTPDTPRVTQPPLQPGQTAPAVQPAGQSSPLAGGTPAADVPTIRGFAEPTPVPLARAAEAVEHVLQLASQRGVTQARIALHPQELGSIDVHLRSTSEGIVARLVAHTPEAAQQLQQAAADLRKSLEQQGLNLLNLDIGHQGEDRSAGRAGAGSDGSGQGGSSSNGDPGDAAAAGDETSTTTSLQLPNGVLVDVLA